MLPVPCLVSLIENLGLITTLFEIMLGLQSPVITDFSPPTHWRHFSLGVPVVIGSRAMITQMRIMVLLLALLALLGGAALAFVAFEMMRPHPTEQVPAP